MLTFSNHRRFSCRAVALLLAWLCAFWLAGNCCLGQLRQVHLLQTSDIHGTFTNEDSRSGGSWLRLASAIQNQRQLLGADSLLLIDCGDTCQGSIAATLSKGEAAIDALRHLKYDVWVPGNHELDFGHRQFGRLTDLAREFVLCGNLHLRSSSRLPSWKMFRRNGVNIAVIGATASYMKNWLLPSEASQYQISTAAALLEQVLPEIHRLRPDVIVLATHQGWFEGHDPRKINEVADLAKSYPEIDVILGGHTHRLFPGLMIGHRTWYVQPAYHAQFLGLITLTVDVGAHEVIDVSSHALPATDELPEDLGLTQAIQPWLDKASQERQRIIGQTLTSPITAAGRPGFNCGTSELLSAAIANASQADAVLHGKLTEKSLHGQMTGADLFALIPFENTIVLADVTATELEEILTEQWRHRQSYRYCGLYGARAKINASGQATMLGMGKDGTRPAQGQRLTLAMNSHTAAGSGWLPKLIAILQKPEANCRDTGISTRRATEDFLRQLPKQQFQTSAWLTKE